MFMKVPLLDLKPQMELLREEVLLALNRVVESNTFILGPEVDALEKSVASYCGVSGAVGVSSGTDALLISLMALGIGHGDEVLTTPYSFFATMGSILRVGARPVFADIDEETLNIDPELMAEQLHADRKRGSRIKALIPVHLYGQCADMEKIMRLAEEFELPVIEDAAQAIGADCPFVADGQVTWRRAGAMGLSGCFSFFPSKNLGGMGDGGMVTSNDQNFIRKLRIFRNHGADPKYYHAFIGGNFRLDAIQASVLNIKLKHLDQWHKSRRQNAETYNRLFADAGLLDGQVRLPEAVYQKVDGAREHNHHIYNQYVIRVFRRDDLMAHLLEKGIGCAVYYPICLHRQQCLGGTTDADISLPVAERAAKETLALPVFPELSDDQQQYVVQTIKEFYRP